MAESASDDGDDDDAKAAGNLSTTMDLGADDASASALDVQKIDTYWLQRAITEAYAAARTPLDAPGAQSKERAVMQLLESGKAVTDMETELVELLGFERFELIKVRARSSSSHVLCRAGKIDRTFC